MTTHYLEEADSLCNRIAIIDHGTIKVLDSPEHLKERLGGNVLTLGVNPTDSDLSEFFRNIAGTAYVLKKAIFTKLSFKK